MKEYISTIIYISIVVIIMEMITPNTKLKKYVLSLASLSIFLVVISPVINIFKKESFSNITKRILATISNEYENSGIDYDKSIVDITENAITKSTEEKINEEITKYLKTTYKIENIETNCILNEDYTLKELVVNIRKENIMDKLTFASNIIAGIETEYKVPSNKIKIIVGE